MLETETKRLFLRNWCLSDSKDLFEYARSELVGPNAGWQPHKNENESKKIIKMFINDNDVLAIELKSEKKVIGSIGLHDRRPDQNNNSLNQCEIGFVLNPKYWGNGFIPEAVKKLLEIGFNDMGMEYLWCGHFEHNLRSKRVNEKCGFNYRFKKEEIKLLLNDKKVVTYYYSITKPEYLEIIKKEECRRMKFES